MSVTHQLVMFEPVGSELASLARKHAKAAQSLQLQADNLILRGFQASAAAYFLLSELAEDRAMVCEIALQFETLAGLV